MNPIQKKKLKALAHALNPVVMIGQAGLTDEVLKEINVALNAHELIKVRIRAERDDRRLMSEHIATATQAENIQSIGQISVFYRKNPNK